MTSQITFRKVVAKFSHQLAHPSPPSSALVHLSIPQRYMAPIKMMDEEIEASMSLLHMMQPSTTIATDVMSLTDHGNDVKNRDTLHDSLMKVVAKQASDELSLPRIAAQKKIQRRGLRLTALSYGLTLEELRPHFGRPIVEVAREFGICTTFLKKICRRCGIKRWPHRQIRSLNRTIEMLEQVESVATDAEEKARYAAQIEEIKDKQRAVIEDPNASGKLITQMKKYAVPKRATDPMSTPVGQDSESLMRPMTTTFDGDTKNLSALAIGVDVVSSVLCFSNCEEARAFKTKVRLEASQRSTPLDVQIPSSILTMTPVVASMTTPVHARASDKSFLMLKMSPSDHKLTLHKTNEDVVSALKPTTETPSLDSTRSFFECNVCLDTVSSPVVTLCGHLYCWPCLYEWMQNHSECPVCKAGISEENVIPVYARGTTDTDDSRTNQQGSDNGVPDRPQGQRPDAEQLRRRRPFNFGIFIGSGRRNAFSISQTTGFFPALFRQPPALITHHQDGTPLTPLEAYQQMQQASLSRYLLIAGSLVILYLITF
ncbi:unnamed protein product [Peronospora belbahrii]|uniref:RING-type E3 ubiquitin transferase n=1 Tax=Peronospora belbahrii TaxID=622444 RepID=A0AAU9L2E8_9STRA|nr:unnamed protein product [Peronospora belbahrii]